MADEQPRPATSIAAVGAVASDVVAGLKQQPLALGLIVMNILGVSAALWFLARLTNHNTTVMQMILKACLPAVTGGQ